MALVSISEAAKLVRRNRSTIYRDIERGRLSKTVSPEGETQIETSELLRAYGRLHGEDDGMDPVARDRMRIAILEERTKALERALALEAELRKVKDQVTTELRARLADKENVIKVLESKVLFLEYDKQVEASEHGHDDPTTLKPDAAMQDQPLPGQAGNEQGPPRHEEHADPSRQAASAADYPATSPASNPPSDADRSGATHGPQMQAAPSQAEHVMPRKGWWARFLKKR
ncbi:hypothetical protein [Noviherbaspirillum galbum]|uniref:Helix-turn-helix domain-containing protein n=1 Tax=Noviherbaspirillum galbum TaxID=2709383 RepID=A0A6B3SV56_9BURK|nr:hypothetical protein [Noviherbaspirillum galbum]NEX64504.1 hypothetical protein [Noviherbaspirillum galbum]